jgi:hypothetical protein
LVILVALFAIAAVPLAALIAARGNRRAQMVRVAIGWPILVVFLFLLLHLGGSSIGANASMSVTHNQEVSGGGGASW